VGRDGVTMEDIAEKAWSKYNNSILFKGKKSILEY
jgi:hypothetical protein